MLKKITASQNTAGVRAVERCDLLGLSPHSSEAGTLTRTYLTPAHKSASAQIAQWMREAGMSTRTDPAGNLIGRYEGLHADAPALIFGSHVDSVRNAGHYDGPLGIMLGIECVAKLSEAGRRFAFAIEVIAFGDEEGSRFPTAMLTSRAFAGTAPADALEICDTDGISVRQALIDFGLDPAAFFEARRDPASVLAFVEAHIEQGPVLEAEDLPVGMVAGIASQLRYRATLKGMAAHAGTAAMHLRSDALAAAAQCVAAVEKIGQRLPPDLVATVGRMVVIPNAPNVVPGEVRFTLDVRAGSKEARDRAANDICTGIEQICDARGIGHLVERMLDLPPSPCDPALSATMLAAISAAGVHPRTLVSGAGHDAMILSALCPTAMLFLRCKGGISHNPAESVDPADVQIAADVLMEFINKFAAQQQETRFGT